MGRRASACPRTGGGDDIPALGARGLRLTTGAAALFLLAGLAVYPAVATHREPAAVAGLGAAGCALMAVGLVGRRPAIAASALVLFGGEYALYLRLGSNGVDRRAPFVAGALIAVAELAFRSTERAPGRPDGRLLLREGGRLALAVAATVVVAEVVLVAAGSVRSTLLFEVLGMAAALTALSLVLRIAARARRVSP